jgi:hypothetical protein
VQTVKADQNVDVETAWRSSSPRLGPARAHRICSMGDGNGWFLPNTISLVSSCIVPREDVVPTGGNGLLPLHSVSSTTRVPLHQITELSSVIREIETNINTHWDCP